jgi:hypothetical protein
MKTSHIKVIFRHLNPAEFNFQDILSDLNANHPEHLEALKQLFSDAFGGEKFLNNSPLPLWNWVEKECTILDSFPKEVKETITKTLRLACRESDMAVELKTHIANRPDSNAREVVRKIIEAAAQPIETVSIYDYAIGIQLPEYSGTVIVNYAINTRCHVEKVRVQNFLNHFYSEVMRELSRGTTLLF